MKLEDKKLLLQDLCARLPYGVKMYTPLGVGHLCDINLNAVSIELGINIDAVKRDYFDIINCKPYLRPMSTMTEEEKKELNAIIVSKDDTLISIVGTSEMFDYLNKKMFDYRGLIPRGCAIAVTEENNPYKD